MWWVGLVSVDIRASLEKSDRGDSIMDKLPFVTLTLRVHMVCFVMIGMPSLG